MMKLQGEKYEQKLVSESEANDKLQEMTSGMMMVYNYAIGIPPYITVVFIEELFLCVIGLFSHTLLVLGY